MSAAMPFELPTEQDELAELSQFGIDLSPNQPPEQIDATASDLLRLIARERAEAERYHAAKLAEIQKITARYERLTSPHEIRAARYEAWVCELALSANFGPKKKSRDVGHGTYGVRRVPARLSILDPAELLAWAKTSAPDLVQEVVSEKVPHKALEARFKETGELPPGVDYTPETEKAYAKPHIEGPHEAAFRNQSETR